MTEMSIIKAWWHPLCSPESKSCCECNLPEGRLGSGKSVSCRCALSAALMRGAIQAVASFSKLSMRLMGLPAPKPCAPSDFGISAIATSSHFVGHC